MHAKELIGYVHVRVAFMKGNFSTPQWCGHLNFCIYCLPSGDYNDKNVHWIKIYHKF